MDKCILIIDDDQDLVAALTVALQSEDYRVVSAYDGEAGFAAAVRERPDLVVLDVMMKTMTEGVRVARQLHNHAATRGTPILMLSAIKEVLKLTEDLASDEASLPIHSFMEKPVATDRFLGEIRALLARSGGV
jgi:DNA-binding response OmpR family regulator